MAFKRAGRAYYWIEPSLPGLGRIGKFSTGQNDKRLAEQMENGLHELAMTGEVELLEQLRDRKIKLSELWQAKLKGREALDELRRRSTDPILAEAVKAFRSQVADSRINTGLDQLLEFVQEVERAKDPKRKQVEIRLSWLTDPTNLTALYAHAVSTGRAANTVRRSLHRAVADLLSSRFGRGRMLAIMADAKVPGENDERKALLSPEEVLKSLEAADPEFSAAIGFAVTTGIDRTPMLAGIVADYDEGNGTLHVRDEKTHARTRTLILRDEPLLENAEYWLRKLIAGRAAHEPLVPLTQRMIRTRWDAVRKSIGREDVRWKDLRGIFATYYLLAGGDPRNLQLILGHTNMTMTMRYLRRLPAGNKERLKEAARAVGRMREMLKVKRA